MICMILLSYVSSDSTYKLLTHKSHVPGLRLISLYYGIYVLDRMLDQIRALHVCLIGLTFVLGMSSTEQADS